MVRFLYIFLLLPLCAYAQDSRPNILFIMADDHAVKQYSHKNGVYILEQRDTDAPFLLMTHYKAAHDPWDAPERFHPLFKNTYIPEPPNLLDT